MSRICAASIERIVVAGRREYRVRPATAREAILYYRALHGVAHHGSSADRDVLCDLLRAWLPLTLSSYLTRPARPTWEIARFVHGLLDAGAQQTSPEDSASEPSGESALERLAEMDWDLYALDVAAFMGTPLVAAYELPWEAFLAALDLVTVAEARATLRGANAAAAPYMKAEDLEALAERARAGKGAAAPEPPKADPERIRRDRARLYEMMYGRPDPHGGAAPQTAPE